MANLQYTFTASVLVIALLGAHAAVVPKQTFSHKTPQTLQTNTTHRVGIYHGKFTSIKKHPYMAAVFYFDIFICAATIISEEWVLLSADCLYGSDAESLKVVVAADVADGNSGKEYPVVDVIIHPQYYYVSSDYNFGLLKVRGKFKWSKTVKRARLPKKEAKVGSNGVIVGWGNTHRTGEIFPPEGGSLKEGIMKFISREDCESIYATKKITITDRMGCTYNEGKVTPCDNDYGDPIIKMGTVYQLFLFVGEEKACTRGAYPAINADVFPMVQWIKNTTKLQDEEE